MVNEPHRLESRAMSAHRAGREVAPNAAEKSAARHPRGSRPASEGTVREGALPASENRAALVRTVGQRAGNAAARRVLRTSVERSAASEAPDLERDTLEAPAAVPGVPLHREVAHGGVAQREDDPPAHAPEAAEAEGQPGPRFGPITSSFLERAGQTRQQAVTAVDLYTQDSAAFAAAAKVDDLPGITPELHATWVNAFLKLTEFEMTMWRINRDLEREVDDIDADRDALQGRAAGVQDWEGMEEWTAEVGSVWGRYQGVAERVLEATAQLADYAVQLAQMGRKMQQPDYVQGVLAAADQAQAHGARPAPSRPSLNDVEAAATKHDKRSLNFARTDFFNNAVAVITGAIGLASTAVAAAVAGSVSAAFGTLMAAIGTALAIRAAWHASGAIERISGIEQYLTSDQMKGIAKYAKRQKERKRDRQVSLAGLGGMTFLIGAGTLALAIAGVATGGIALGIAGLVVAGLALTVVFGKWIRSKYKRSREQKVAKQMVDSVFAGFRSGEPEATAIYNRHNGNREAIEGWAQREYTQRRHNTAAGLVGSLESEVPSEKFNAETLVEALGVSPQDVRTAAAEDPAKAIGLVERKLASW